MPKVISRAAVSTSDSAPATASSKAILRTYYCLCGEFLLVIDKSLDKLPRRPSDGAIVVRCRDDTERGKIGRKFKLNAVEGKRHLVKRQSDGALESRQPLLCSRCNTAVAYQTHPGPVGSGSFVYILKGALTEQQGRVPADAFTDEHLYAVTAEETQIRMSLSEAQEKEREKMKLNQEMVEKVEKEKKRLESGGAGGGWGGGGGTCEEVLDSGNLD